MAAIFAGAALLSLVRIWAVREVPPDGSLESAPTVVLLAPFLAGFVATVGLATLLTLAVSYQIETELLAERQRTESANQELQRLAETDDLTGLHSRGRTEELLTLAAADAAAISKPLAVIMLDIDSFKDVNDTFGHGVGDSVLQDVATTLTRTARPTDVIGRWGGEEFLLVAPGTDVTAAQSLSESLRHGVSRVLLPDSRPVTASFGIALHRPGESTSDVVRRADNALYGAKAAGRNRVEVA
jgi:diguanylate cyclase (GGDEF)-like protein